MRAIARDFHDTMQIVTDDIMRYRSFTLNPHQFDASWKRVKTVLRMVSDLSRQIGDRAQRVKTVFFMCNLNPPQNKASWKQVKTVCMWFPTSTPKLTVELNESRYALFADGIAVWDPVPNSTHLQRPKLEWGRLDWLH